ncbi:MAG: HEAT repeat domain-containing protein [Pseudomonadota bacterium]
MKRCLSLLLVCLVAPDAAAQLPNARHGELRQEQQPTAAPTTLRRRLGIEVAIALLNSKTAIDRQRGFERLGSIGSAQALDLLLNVFETGGAARSARDRLLAVRALAPHAAVPSVREFLVRIMVGVGSNPDRPEAIDGMIEHAAALALAQAGDDASLAALGKALRQPGHVADTARDALLAFPPRALAPLVSDLRSPTRIFARFLGELADPRAIPALRELVRSAPIEVRPEAAVALARLRVSDTIELARQWLRVENSPDFQLAAARILLEFKAPDAGIAVARLLVDPRAHSGALELANAASLPAVAPTLVQLAGNAPPEERSALFAALGLSASPSAVSFLGGALGTRETASAAALALGLAPGSGAEAVLEQALRNPSTRRVAARASLVRQVALARTPSGLGAALQELAQSRDPSDQAVAIQAKVLGAPEQAAALLKTATTPQIMALSRLALLPSVARALCERLATERAPQRREALAAGLVSNAAAERVPSDVLLALIDARGLAAPLAARALSTRDSHTLRPKILALLASSDTLLRSHAALGLGRSDDSSALGVLEQAYRFETDDNVRLAIVHGLSTRHEPARKRTLLLARSLDSSPAVREAAALALAGAQPASDAQGSETAWLELRVPSAPEPGPAPALGALVIDANGLALPAFADPDGVLLLPALPSGPFELRLAAPARTDDALRPKQP